MGLSSFTAAAPKTWNVLPDYIRKGKNFDMFLCYFIEAYRDLVELSEILSLSTFISFFLYLLLVFSNAKLLM